jgi:hypothetical protein
MLTPGPLTPTDQYTSRACAWLAAVDSAQAPATRLTAARPRAQTEVRCRLGERVFIVRFSMCRGLDSDPVPELQAESR